MAKKNNTDQSVAAGKERDDEVRTPAEPPVPTRAEAELPTDEIPTKPETAEDIVAGVEAKPTEAAWDVETWLSVAKQRIGVEGHTLWAALREVDKDAVYTERQIRVLVERYLNKPVRRGNH